MGISNKDEYQIIRGEMQRLKNCITTYMGWVLGGFGLSVISTYAVRDSLFEDGVVDNAAPVAVALLLLAITISMVLYVIFYKFNSHNWYAGYCKLLNQEQFWRVDGANLSVVDIDVMSWETCVGILRDSNGRKNPFKDVIIELVNANVISSEEAEGRKSVLGSEKSAGWEALSEGLRLIFLGRCKESTPSSWQFPLYVVRVFLTLCAIYLVLSLYAIIPAFLVLICGVANLSDFCLCLAYAVLLSVIAFIWIRFVVKLHKVMVGSSSVDAYCWRFLPIRFKFIQRKAPGICYSLITLKDILAD
jgi:hypothetical protein